MELICQKLGKNGINGEHLLERLDLPVSGKQFLDQRSQFSRFEETLPYNLSVQIIPQLIAGKANQKIDRCFLVVKTEGNARSKKTIRRG